MTIAPLQLSLFSPVPDVPGLPNGLRAVLDRFPAVGGPWGTLDGHALRYVVQSWAGHDQWHLLLERRESAGNLHRWHITWAQGRLYGSGAGWGDGSGLSLLRAAARVVRLPERQAGAGATPPAWVPPPARVAEIPRGTAALHSEVSLRVPAGAEGVRP